MIYGLGQPFKAKVLFDEGDCLDGLNVDQGVEFRHCGPYLFMAKP